DVPKDAKRRRARSFVRTPLSRGIQGGVLIGTVLLSTFADQFRSMYSWLPIFWTAYSLAALVVMISIAGVLRPSTRSSGSAGAVHVARAPLLAAVALAIVVALDPRW